MSFSAATCITFNPGTQTGTDLFDVYLNEDYTPPIFSSVTVSQLTTNCPFIFDDIPDGTDNLWLKDEVNNICITIPIQNNDICSNCNLGFSNYSATSINRIYCGILTGSCQTITDYVINWYGPNDTTTLQFTSGLGDTFLGEYNITHPFLGNSGIPQTEGIYTPVISKIILSGITFSNTGGTNNILFSGNCLSSTIIQPLSCSNKTNTKTNWPYSAYSHNIFFESTSGVIPQAVTSSYNLSASTKFLALSFNGLQNPDRVTVTFSGTSYPIKIGLEDVLIGSSLPSSNFNLTSFPKSAKTSTNSSYFTKIICLTGLTVYDNDKLEITVTPYDNITTWDLYLTCLDDYNCNECLLTQEYKILGSSITGITGTCNVNKVQYQISGCSFNYSDASDYVTYYSNGLSNIISNIQFTYNLGNTNTGLYYNNSRNLYYTNITCGFPSPIISSSNCDTDNTPTYYSKTFLGDGRGVFTITGSSNVISTYYNSWNNAINGVYSGSTNSSNLSYYRLYKLNFPNPSNGINCDDAETGLEIILHHTSNVYTGSTGTGYLLTITANTITNNLSYNTCDIGCNTNILSVVNQVNNASTGLTSNYTANYKYITPYSISTGKYFTNPVSQVNYVTESNTPITADTNYNYSVFVTTDWSSNTYPFSGVTPTLIPSFSGTVCNNYNNTGNRVIFSNSYYNSHYKYYYETRLINPSDIRDFEIWASPITNLNYSGAPGTVLYELAYQYSGGSTTYSNPTYII